MRNFIDIIDESEHLEEMSARQIGQLKAVISTKIKELPADDATIRALQEIEELLSSVAAGGRLGIINNKLGEIEDAVVRKAQKMLARYILSIPMTMQQRDELFNLWKADKLVNRKKLLSPGKKTITDVINGYDSNAAIKELTDDLSQVAALGQGKGEFLLNVFSKNIMKLQKGDLQIDGKTIELKTYDVGGGRFYDQDVRPSAQFGANVENFLQTWANYIQQALPNIAKTGLKLSDVMYIRDMLNPKDVTNYDKSFKQVLDSIFPGVDTKEIMNAVKAGGIGPAKAAYAKANLNYYLGIKKDDGILYIDLRADPTTLIYFKDYNELTAGGMRLHADTVYPVTTDPRNAYPQMSINTSKAVTGGEVAATGEKAKVAPTPKPKAPGTTLGIDDIQPSREKRSTNVGSGRERR